MEHAPVSPESQPMSRGGMLIRSLTVALALGLTSLGVYHAYYKSATDQQLSDNRQTISDIASAKSRLQSEFDQSLTRIESLQMENGTLQQQLSEQGAEIESSKKEIRRLLGREKLSAGELAQARSLIQNLQVQVGQMETSLASLKAENQQLADQNQVLTTEKQSLTDELALSQENRKKLEKTIDVASTLNASNISITPMNVKKNGKTKATQSFKKADKIVVQFDLSNRIIQPGTTYLYVMVKGPDGQPLSSGDYFSGPFDTRDEGEKQFTAKFPVTLETNKPKNVSFSFDPENDFVQGDYTIEIYQNGFLIGKGVSSLKKGGLFS